MRFPQIPDIENAWSSVTIRALSPSSFSWVNHGCRYQILLQNAIKTLNNDSLSLPSNKNAILGTIIHKIYELTIKGELKSLAEIKNKWEDLIASEKGKLSDKYPTLRNASLNDYDKRNCAIRYAMGMMRKSDSASSSISTGRQILSEKWLDCSALGLKGIADKLVIDSGYVDVIDFKSGHVCDDNGNVKAEYCVQLHLYAEMCRFLSLGSPRKLLLVDIDGEYYDVPYSQAFCDQLLTDVKDAISALNETIKKKQFVQSAKPELGMCSICNCRHLCKYRQISSDTFYQTISGVVKSIPSSNMYVIQDDDQTIYYISGLDVYEVESPYDYIGKKLTFVNVIHASQQADDFTYKTTENTLIYEQL